jgi:two-component system response regulator HydG
MACAALGDHAAAAESARAALAETRSAHLPLAGLRLHAVLLSATSAVATREATRVSTRIRTALARGALPPLLRRQLATALQSAERPATSAAHTAQYFSVDDVQALLERAFGAEDDRAGVSEVCRALLERLRAATVQITSACSEHRLLARAGRSWNGDLRIVERTLAAHGPSCSLPGDVREAASPITYAGSVIGVLACRWTAVADPDMCAAVSLLRAGALAAAPSVRTLLDRSQISAALDTTLRDLIGSGSAMMGVREAMARAARAPYPVLIEGESGSGKELVARGIHRLSSRRDRRICAVNCAAISDELVEAELFGHARGAFTGAIGERPGLFEEADGGTMFLDEIAELSVRAQAKLLRALQEGEVRRVGENFPRRVDARVIAATNRQLEEEVQAGRFRADLRFRLDVVRISIPPLRDRPADIPQLAAHFWEEACRRVESRASLAPETLVALTRYEWPGNVRQLQNVVAALAVHAPRRGRVQPSLLPAHIARSAIPPAATFDAAREEFERRFVRAALAQTGGQRARAARVLGVTRQGLAKMLRRLRIDPEVSRAAARGSPTIETK